MSCSSRLSMLSSPIVLSTWPLASPTRVAAFSRFWRGSLLSGSADFRRSLNALHSLRVASSSLSPVQSSSIRAAIIRTSFVTSGML
uniref:Putative secreted protein n=1 Tax=Anopheles triannulatus TaxID=58253 RepID=A0A2M4B325_9DIPT